MYGVFNVRRDFFFNERRGKTGGITSGREYLGGKISDHENLVTWNYQTFSTNVHTLIIQKTMKRTRYVLMAG